MKIFSRICLAFLAVVTIVLIAVSLWRGSSKPKLLASDASTPSPAHTDIFPAAQGNAKPTTAAASQPVVRQLPVAKPQAMLAFDRWAEKYLSAPEGEKASLLKEGIHLAQARQSEMVELIRNDPEKAIEDAVPYALRKAMPIEISSFFETQVSGLGRFVPLYFTPLPGRENEVPQTQFAVTIGSTNTFLHSPTNYDVPHPPESYKQSGRMDGPIRGVAVGTSLAMGSPLGILDDSEAADLPKSTLISGDPSNPIIAQVGASYFRFPSRSSAKTFGRTLEKTMASSGRKKALIPPTSSATQGRFELLLIPVAFWDDPRPPISQDAAQRALEANNKYFVEGSYGTASWFSTVTPVFTLPQRKAYYGENIGQVKGDAVALAVAAGYNAGAYKEIYIMFNSVPGISFGGRSDGLLNGSIGSITHELGHNFGLGHANYWDVSGKTPPPTNNLPVDRDSELGHSDINAPFRLGMVSMKVPIEEYGNIYEVMGSGGGHFSIYEKWQMNWLPQPYIKAVSKSETNRIYAFDTPHIVPGRLYGMDVHKDFNVDFLGVSNADAKGFERGYWVSHREGFDNNPFMENGIEVLWGAMLLDTTYETAPGKNDSAVVIGRTFADSAASVYITPIAKGGGPAAGDKWVDVVVNYGPFPTNEAPTLSLTASSLVVPTNSVVTFVADATDPNGDALAYNWDFGDTSFGFNSATNSKTFTGDGQYVVRCDVSDMRGGVASKYLVVVVGSPTNVTMNGRVIDSNGNPVRGVRVHNGGTPPPYTPPPSPGLPATPPPPGTNSYRYAYTDNDGYYTIGNVPNGTFQAGAFIFGYITRPLGFSNPLTVADGDINDLNFLAEPLQVVSIAAGQDASEPDRENPGFLTVTRQGIDVSQELKVRFGINGTALSGVDYDILQEQITSSLIVQTNDGTVTTNIVFTTNTIGQVVFAPYEISTNIYVRPIDNAEFADPRNVLLTLMLQTNDMRFSTLVTNVATTNIVGTNIIVTTNTLLLTITNLVGIPGWELLPSGPDNTLTWFQTPPTYVISNGEASINIIEDEPPGIPQIFISALDDVATEGGEDNALLAFIRFGGSLSNDLVIHYTTGGTASNGFDYLPLSGSITIPAGEAGVLLPVVGIKDLFVEGDETVEISLVDDPAYVGVNSATLHIIDDDLPQLYIYASDSVADHTGNGGTITVARSGDLSSDLLVNYLVTGTASAGVDYNILSGSITIPANQITADIQITPLPNAPAGERTVIVALSESQAYNIHYLNTATVTIRDTLPVVTLTTTAATAAEGGASGVFTVTRTGDTSNSLNVYFAVGGLAVEGSDYTAIGTNVVIPAGASSVTIPVIPKEDKFDEVRGVNATEYVIVQLLKGPNYNLGNSTSGTVTLTDNDLPDFPAVGFMLPSSSAREDAGGAATIFVRTSGNPETNKPVRVFYRITAGTAVPNVNYVPFGTGIVEVLHFTAPSPPDPFVGSEGGIDPITIPILDDGVAAGNKTFTVQLFNYVGYITNLSYVTNGTIISTNTTLTPYPTNYYIGPYSSHTFTIIDIGVTTVDISATVSEAYEEGRVPGAFTVTRSGGPINNPLTVKLSISGSAANGSDYVRIPDTVTIPAGTNQVVIPVIPIDDPQEEYVEFVNIGVVATPGMKPGSSASVAIFDNDGTIQFTRQTYAVDEGATNAVIGVVRSGNTNLPLTVEYLVRDGTASNGVDYASVTNGTLSFAAGEILKTFTIGIIDDSIVEGPETISLVLTNPTGGLPLGGQRTATLVIIDNDTLFQFSTNVFRVNENGTNGIVVINREGVLTSTAKVDFRTANGTATNGLDYRGTNLTLTFAPGETNKTLLIPILDDALFEGDETVLLSLSNPGTNSALGVLSNSILAIIDDECSVQFASTNFNVAEYEGVVSVEVRRLGGTVNPFSLSFFTRDGTANGSTSTNQDYVPRAGSIAFVGDGYVSTTNGSGTLFFQPGETNKFINIAILDDILGEGNENFFVTLTNLVRPPIGTFTNSILLGSVSNATVTILDNETAGNVDYEYAGDAGANGPVYALALQSDSKTVFGGDFTTFNGFSFRRIARLTPDGFLDNSFNPGAGANGVIRAIAMQPDGKVILGGLFTSIDSTNRTNVARLNANGNLDLTFNAGSGPNNLVRAAVVQPDGHVILGGDFTSVNGTPRSRIARLNSDGTVDGSFAASADGSVYALALQNDGKVLVGGGFTNVNGATHNGIARLTTGGALDGTFNEGTGADGLVRSLALQTNGMILLAGDFGNVNGAVASRLARLTTSGSVDVSFDPGFGPDASVNSIAVHSGGKMVVGGNFTSVNGFPRNHFARLRANGAIDFTFNLGSGANSNVNAVVMQSNSALVIGGEFTTVNNLTRNRIARIHGDDRFVPTAVDFSSLAYNVFENAGSAVITVVRSGNTNSAFSVDFGTANGTAVAGQDYTATNGTLTFAAGQTTKTFSVPIINDSLLELDETVNLFLTNAPVIVDIGLPSVLVIKDDEKSVQFASTNFSVIEHATNALLSVVRSGVLTGEVYVSCFTRDGSASSPADYTATSNLLYFAPNIATQTFVIPIIDDFRKESNETVIVTLSNPTAGTALGTFFGTVLTIVDDDNGPGSPDPTFDPGLGASSLVKALAVQSDGKMLIGGAFTNVGGLERHYVARLGTNGAVDPGFNTLIGPNALVSSVATNSAGKVLIGGNFSAVNGTNRNRFAQLASDGSLDSSFGGSNGINSAIFSVLPQPNNRALVSGAFSAPFNRIGRLRSDGTPDSTFFLGSGPNGTVYSAASQPDGKVIIGGDFTTVNGLTRYRVARVDNDGTLDLNFQPPVVVTGAVFSVAVAPDGKVLIAGDFTLVNGTNRNRIARLNQDGSLDTGFDPGAGANAIIYAVAAQPDGKALIGGDFTTFNRTNRNRIARLNLDGSLDTSFEPGVGPNNTVFALVPLRDGKVLIGGSFSSVSSLPRAGIARLAGDDPIDVTFQPNSIYLNGQFTIFFTSQAGQAYIIEASVDLVSWNPLATVTATGALTGYTDLGAGAYGQRFYRVRLVDP